MLEIFNASHSVLPSFRTFHLDSNVNAASISAAQVRWFNQTARALAARAQSAALLFFHIPLEEYDAAARSGAAMSGHWNEKVSYQPVSSGLFDALHAQGDVKATFCGHDHTNDFCVGHHGVQLCYEGSPGYQAYGKIGWARRARVTELRQWGSEVWSWKRLDDAALSRIDMELLWQSSGGSSVERVGERRRPSRITSHDALPHRSQNELRPTV